MIGTSRAQKPVICSNCRGKLSWEYNIYGDANVVSPCPRCLKEYYNAGRLSMKQELDKAETKLWSCT